MQAIELEERQADLTDANHEVRAQRDELERAAAQLADEKRRAELYGEFADRLAAEGNSEKLARIALIRLAEAAPTSARCTPRRGARRAAGCGPPCQASIPRSSRTRC